MRLSDRRNAIGISFVRLLDRSENLLKVKGADILVETLLLDIKPYISEFDRNEKVQAGWLKSKLQSDK